MLEKSWHRHWIKSLRLNSPRFLSTLVFMALLVWLWPSSQDKITKLFEALEKNPPPEVQLALLTAAETDLSDAGLARLFFDDSATIFGETISQQAKQAAQSQIAQTGGQKPAVTGAKPAVVVETPPAAAATPPASPTEALPKDPRGPPPASVADAATTPKPAEPPRAQQPVPAAPAVALDIAQTLQAIEAEAAKAPVLSEQGPVVGSPVEVEVPRLPKDGEVMDLAARLNERELAGKLSKAGDITLTDPEGNTLTMRAQPDPAGSPGSRLWKRSEQPSVPFVKGEIIWVEENAFMKKDARQYQSGATQAQSSVASKKSVVPQINYVRPNGTVGTVRFDGLDGRTLIDRKLSVYRTLKSQKQILRQSEALSQNGLRARWETKDSIECNGARSLLKKLGISNIDVEVVPYE